MDIRITRVLYSFFMAVFALAAIYIIFYALGYKYNFEKKRVEKTGVLFLKSYPRAADIYLNGKKIKEATPAMINRLLPNTYEIKVSKPGYFEWTKSLPVNPQTTTFAEDITLFKNEHEFLEISQGDFRGLSANPGKTTVSLVEQNQSDQTLWFYDIDNNRLRKSISGQSLELISWCNSGSKMIVKGENGYQIVNSETSLSLALAEFTKINFKQLKCDFYNDNIFYGLNDLGVYQVDALAKSVSQVISGKILTFEPWKTNLYYIAAEKERSILKIHQGSSEVELLIIPMNNYNFISSGKKYLALLNLDKSEAYILDPSAEPIYRALIKNTSHLAWHNDNFIHWNDFELYVHFSEEEQSNLLERSSEPIKNAFWHSGVVNIFGQTGDSLKVYEIDGREHRNVHNLMQLSGQTGKNIFVNAKGDYLYLAAEVEGQKGFYRVKIQ